MSSPDLELEYYTTAFSFKLFEDDAHALSIQTVAAKTKSMQREKFRIKLIIEI